MVHSIPGALAHIKAELGQVLPDAAIEDTARAVGHRWRARLLTPCVTVHLFLLQLLARVALSTVVLRVAANTGLRRVCPKDNLDHRCKLDRRSRWLQHALRRSPHRPLRFHIRF
jgi:hypothetical protein